MEIFRKKELEELWKISGSPCISMYIPTHPAGREVKEGKDSLALKNQIQEVRRKLEKNGLRNDNIDKLMAPAEQLLEDSGFWSQQQDGLAIFISEGFFRYFRLPIKFRAKNEVEKCFHLRELLPMLSGDGSYFILALSLNKMRLFEANRDSIYEINMGELAPEGMKTVMEHYEQEQSLQFHSASTPKPGNSNDPNYHGQGGGKDNQEAYVREYLRLVDDAIGQVIADEQTPMIMVSVEELQPVYKSITKHAHLVDNHVHGNPDHMKPQELHEKTWANMEGYFSRHLEEQKAKYGDLAGTGKTSYDIRQIVPAAVDGRIESLFLRHDLEHHWGKMDDATHEVEVHDQMQDGDDCLVNVSAVKTVLNGGDTFTLEKEQMPENGVDAPMVAIFRY